MDFNTLVERVVHDTTQVSLWLFAPELVLCVTIVLLLFVRLFNADRFIPTYWMALLGALVSFMFSLTQFYQLRTEVLDSSTFFTGLLVFDQFTAFFRLFLSLFLTFVVALTVLSGIPDEEDGPDFYALLLGSTIGMMLMTSANHLLMLFLAVEMTSVPSYAMVGFLKGRKLSSEAALKYVVYGAGAAGVMLYGLSLIGGLLGTANLPEMADRINMIVSGEAGMSDATVRTLMLAALMVLVGVAFKLSIVPFHFWCPDAFEGASAEVAGFLSVASKGAAFALLVRFCLALIGDPSGASLSNMYVSLGIGIGVIAAVTATFGNLAAYAQTNIKRLLAYSTIAHAGYMLMAVGALLVILNAPADSGINVHTEAIRCIEGLLYYLFVYMFMNLGAFAVVALIRNEIFSEEISDYAGLSQQAPALCICMAIFMFSLTGLPPLGGFFAKLVIFASLFKAGTVHWSMWAILAIGGLNTVFSLFYYIRVLKAMFIAPATEQSKRVAVPTIASAYIITVSVPVVLLGIAIQGLSQTAQDVANVILP